MTSKIFSYYDDWKNEVLTCPQCGWQGTFWQGGVEFYEDLMDCECPHCDSSEILAIVGWPTWEEARQNWDKVSDVDKIFWMIRYEWVEAFKATCLKSPDDLPNIDGNDLVFHWDLKNMETVIKCGDLEVWSEMACWCGFDRFAEVAAILKKKYGHRLLDLIPTKRSMDFLIGDFLWGVDTVQEARKKMRPPTNTPGKNRPRT
ncbi:MAG: hypothetical protein AB1641_12265 [Thermodesulfobacteriota bacterium]